MIRPRRVVTSAVAALPFTLATVVGAAPSAHAGVPVMAHGQVSITYTATAFSLCPSGSVDDGVNIVGQWVFEVVGARSDGTRFHDIYFGSGGSYSRPCYGIAKYGNGNGAFVTTLSFVGAGTNPETGVPDIVVVAGGEGSWEPNNAQTISF
jgi:hypothetical protein